MIHSAINLRVLLFLNVLLGNALYLAAQPGHSMYAPVSIPSSEIRKLHSSAAGRDVDLLMHFPEGYDTARTKFPVLFVLDGENDFAPALECLGLLKGECGITEPLVVAVGEGGPIGSANNKRNHDYTPTSIADLPGSGGAPAFLTFIETELIPFVEKNYKADPARRTIYGYSLGGLFVSYALFRKPALFKNFLIGSPALGFDNEKILAFEAEYAARNKDLPVHIFIEVGSLEGEGMIGPNKRLVQTLKSRNYKNMTLNPVILEGARHLTGKPNAMLKALESAYCSKGSSEGH